MQLIVAAMSMDEFNRTEVYTPPKFPENEKILESRCSDLRPDTGHLKPETET